MKVLLSWLREFAPLEGDAETIAAQLTSLGMELESVVHLGEGLDGIVVARVLDVRAHPDADRIRLVDVDAGDGEALQICCGASNMAPGDLVPLATIGTVMPGGMEIARRRMRGEVSNGMLCSAAELEMGDDHSGILVLPDDLEPGRALTDALGIDSDVVYEFDSLPNRPDTLSVMGVARDLAALQGVAFAVPPFDPVESGPDAAGACDVEILAPELCGRFTARVLSGVRVGPSPRWLARRLVAAGLRPINNVVDVSNHVMLELGQPNHTYDLATLPGGGLRVRWAHEAETIETLDGVVRVLDPGDGVIADLDDRAVGIAGVMGGAATEISEGTTDVLLELAWWDPVAIAATSGRLNLHSEASLRFKRGVAPDVAELAARRFAQLLQEVAGAELRPGLVTAEGRLPEPVTVTVRPDRVNALLGTALEVDEMRGLLEPIGFASQRLGEDLRVSVPRWRPDAALEVDVVEEIARHHGYDHLERTVPFSPHTGALSPTQRDRRTLRHELVALGLSEAMPMPFLAPGDLERCGLEPSGLVLANPLAGEESILRTSLLPGLLRAVSYNASHRNPGVQLFELGRVFDLGDGVVTDVEESERRNTVLGGEAEHLATVLAGSEAPEAVELLERLLASVHRGPPGLRAAELAGLHPGRGAVVVVDDVEVGEVGEVHPAVAEAHGITERLAWLRLDLSTLLAVPARVALASPVSRFPSTDIDLAFVVPAEVDAAAVAGLLGAVGAPLVTSVELFDVFRSETLTGGDRSLAYRLRLQAPDRTLTDAEVAEVRAAVIAAAESDLGATLRG